MKRLIAGVLAACLLALAGVESFHAHAKTHEKSCAACSLELNAAGVVVHAPKVAAVRQPVAELIQTASVQASEVFLDRSQARSPPAAA